MALTIRPYASFINLKESRLFKSHEDVCNLISFAPIKRSFHIHAKKSNQEQSQLLQEKKFSFDGEHQNSRQEILHVPSIIHGENDSKVPVYVMLPLDTVTLGGHLHKPRVMNASLMALKSAGVEGVMVDVWWGLVEREGPCKYNWEGYAELVQMVQRHGLTLQMVMSFHQCGGNVGDSCSIPLPPWVLEEISRNPDLVYTDRSGRRNPEYISLGCDSIPVLRGRTPIQVYGDYMRSFRNRFNDYLGGVITEVQVGLGPCGELRYPAYPESNGTWKFPGIGEFQCCMEMRDHEQPQHANCSPEGLNQQVKMATKTAGTELAGENALERYDSGGYAQVIATSRADSGKRLSAFTYLRLNKKLLEGDNWRNMVEFVRDMSDESRNRESDRTVTNLNVRFVAVKMAKVQKEILLV